MAARMAVLESKAGWMSYYFADYGRHSLAIISTMLLVVMACSLHGNVALVSVLIYKSFNLPWPIPVGDLMNINTTQDQPSSNASKPIVGINDDGQILPDYLQFCKEYGMKDWLLHLAYGAGSSLLMYHIVCGYLQWQYYYKQRNEPHKWKCQPGRFLTPSNERHEIIVGTLNMLFSGSISGTMGCWIGNGNYSTVYFRLDEYGYTYLILSIPAIFLYIEASAYYYHRMAHLPFFYKAIHKHHHRYHSPTAYAAVAMSPIEIAIFIICFIVPLFTVPVHAWVFAGNLLYINYFGMLDHSGIKLDSWIPWQPDSMYHDDHHRYFHCNFGFNTTLFDRLHDTLRRTDREYGENIFYGKGRPKKRQ